MVRDENVVIEKVADLIGSDPALLAQTLKIVNSAYYGLPREVTRPQMAIAFLGLSEVYRMVLSLSVINTVSVSPPLVSRTSMRVIRAVSNAMGSS